MKGSRRLEYQNALEDASRAGTLHGTYFWGHGDLDGLAAKEPNGTFTDLVNYRTIHLNYKLGLVWVFACRSMMASHWASTSADVRGGAFGTLVPTGRNDFWDLPL